jgi:murein L,D-transpeptidase YafK
MRDTFLPVLFLLPLIAACQSPAAVPVGSEGDDPAVAVTDLPLATVIDSLGLDARTIRFHVDKSERRFLVYVEDSLLKEYHCVLGEDPIGDKFCQGDRRTPEGTFTFRSKRVHDQWHKFIWIDYPNAESWKRYNARRAEGLIPDGKDIGGEVGIHGVPEGEDGWIDAGADWTWGCIALRNADVDEIYPYIQPMRTILEIVP